jgi:hypothetical protein
LAYCLFFSLTIANNITGELLSTFCRLTNKTGYIPFMNVREIIARKYALRDILLLLLYDIELNTVAPLLNCFAPLIGLAVPHTQLGCVILVRVIERPARGLFWLCRGGQIRIQEEDSDFPLDDEACSALSSPKANNSSSFPATMRTLMQSTNGWDTMEHQHYQSYHPTLLLPPKL